MTAASLAAVIGGLVPAQAAAAPGWRVVRQIGPEGCQNLLSNVVAVGSRDAWAAGDMSISCGASLPLIEHWNGKAWQQRPLPAALDSYDAVVALGASSASNAWLIAAQENSDGVDRLTWNGTAWKAARLPSWAARIDSGLTLNDVLSVFGPANVWNFSLYARQNPALAARFNGHVWRKVYLPGAPFAVSALAARDIWAIGPSRKTMSKPVAQQVNVAMHWNGHTWRSIALPKIKTVSSPQFLGMMAGGPRSLWVVIPTGGPAGARRGYLIHWDGKRWSRVRTPRGVLNQPFTNAQAPDGHGGVWLQGFGPAPADAPRLYHYSHGHWATYRTPAADHGQFFQALAWIPGTRSEWAVGENSLTSDDTRKAVIAKYGA